MNGRNSSPWLKPKGFPSSKIMKKLIGGKLTIYPTDNKELALRLARIIHPTDLNGYHNTKIVRDNLLSGYPYIIQYRGDYYNCQHIEERTSLYRILNTLIDNSYHTNLYLLEEEYQSESPDDFLEQAAIGWYNSLNGKEIQYIETLFNKRITRPVAQS